MKRNTKGKVLLIGAGPGDPGLLTLRAAKSLAQADAVVYDRLVNPALLDFARPDALRHYAGKAPGAHSASQDEINQLIIRLAKDGKVVARLKGGDPFVFGRGGEEAESLQEAGVPFEVIPGITSAIAVPAYAGIPVTHRGLATHFAVITGHEDPEKEESGIPWDSLAGLDTLVFLMGVRNLPGIVQELISRDMPKTTPAAVIEWGTYPRQRTVTGTLEDIVERSQQAGIGHPAVTVIGEVVLLRESLGWFEKLPLFGQRVLVTRSRRQASSFAEALREAGAEVLEFPVFSIEPLKETPELDRALEEIEGYQWIVFPSQNAVEHFFSRLERIRGDIRCLGRTRLGAIGPSTARCLQEKLLKVDFYPEPAVSEEFVRQFPANPKGLRVLYPCAAAGREVIAEGLAGRGASVERAPCYRMVKPEAPPEDILAALEPEGPPLWLTFTSSSSVENLLEALGGKSRLEHCRIASIGPVTSQTVEMHGLRVYAEAREQSIPGLIEAMINSVSGTAG